MPDDKYTSAYYGEEIDAGIAKASKLPSTTGTAGQVLTSTGSRIEWRDFPSGVTEEMANSLWAILRKCAFSEQLTDSEKNAFKTAWGIDDGGYTPPDDNPTLPDTPVEPEEPTLTGISVTWSADSADVGADPRTLIASVKANYSDGSSQTVTGYSVSPSSLAEGANTVTVTYSGKTATKSIAGNAVEPTKTLIGISASYDGEAPEVGTAFRSLSFNVVGNYSDGSTSPIADYSVSAGTIAEGTNKIYINYTGFVANVIVVSKQEDVGDDNLIVYSECTSGGAMPDGAAVTAGKYVVSPFFDVTSGDTLYTNVSSVIDAGETKDWGQKIYFYKQDQSSSTTRKVLNLNAPNIPANVSVPDDAVFARIMFRYEHESAYIGKNAGKAGVL